MRKLKAEKITKLTSDFKSSILTKVSQKKISEAEFKLSQWEDKSLAHINI